MTVQFDEFSDSYDRDLQNALSVTGEDKDFYARRRVLWLARCLQRLNFQPKRVLDFGCGIGSNSPLLLDVLKVDYVLGVDVSRNSIDVARSRYDGAKTKFLSLSEFEPDGSFDVAFCNGVFHHIPPAEREGSLAIVRGSLRRGGLFAFWENNPWNVGTRYVMSRCIFDEDAITITIPQSKRLLANSGFSILRSDSLFYFPAQLKALRPIEKYLHGLPLGGQYQVLTQLK